MENDAISSKVMSRGSFESKGFQLEIPLRNKGLYLGNHVCLSIPGHVVPAALLLCCCSCAPESKNPTLLAIPKPRDQLAAEAHMAGFSKAIIIQQRNTTLLVVSIVIQKP